MPKKPKVAKTATIDASDAAMKDVTPDANPPSTPDPPSGDPGSHEIEAAADAVLKNYAATSARIQDLIRDIGAVAGLHEAAIASEGDARLLGAVPKDGAEYEAWRTAGENVLCLFAAVTADVRDAFCRSGAVCEMLKPLKERAEEVRLEEENLAYRREMLKRDIQAQRGRVSKELNEVELVSAEDTFKAAGVSDSLPMLLSGSSGAKGSLPNGSSCAPSASEVEEPTTPTAPTTPTTRASRRRGAPRTRSGDAESGTAADGNNSTSGNTPHAARNGGATAPAAAVASPNASSKLRSLDPKTVCLEPGHPSREHALMLDRLEYEQAERTRLDRVATETKERMNSRLRRNEEDRQFMANLPKYVAEVRKSLDPMRRILSVADPHDGDANLPKAAHVGAFQHRLLPAEEVAILRELPEPLFVLAREAMAARDAFGSAVTYQVLAEDASGAAVPAKPQVPLYPTASKKDVDLIADMLKQFRSEGSRLAGAATGPGSRSGTGSCEAQQGEVNPPGHSREQVAALHKAHSRYVRIDVHGESTGTLAGSPKSVGNNLNASAKPQRSRTARKRGRSETVNAAPADGSEENAPLLSLSFRFHPALGLVTVSCVSGQKAHPLTADDLCALFPFDFGDRSPNPCNAHLLHGSFEWDRQLTAAKGRPYLWANLLCGLHFPGSLRSRMKDVQEVIPAEFLTWPEHAMNTPAHLRFVDMVAKLRQRGNQMRSLRSQLASLCAKQLPLTWAGVGHSKAPDATLSMFAHYPREEGGEDFEWATAINEQVIQVWAFVAEHPSGVALAGIVGIEPDYPASKGHIRVSSHGKIVVPGADIREIEDNVNPPPPEPRKSDKLSGAHGDAWSVAKGSATGSVAHGASLANGIESSACLPALAGSLSAQNRADWLSVVPDDYAISAQMMRLLVCLDTVASAMGERAKANVEIPGSEVRQDPSSGLVHSAADEGSAVNATHGHAVRKRKMKGRGRSKLQSSS